MGHIFDQIMTTPHAVQMKINIRYATGTSCAEYELTTILYPWYMKISVVCEAALVIV